VESASSCPPVCFARRIIREYYWGGMKMSSPPDGQVGDALAEPDAARGVPQRLQRDPQAPLRRPRPFACRAPGPCSGPAPTDLLWRFPMHEGPRAGFQGLGSRSATPRAG
jgi:hypothetical protein